MIGFICCLFPDNATISWAKLVCRSQLFLNLHLSQHLVQDSRLLSSKMSSSSFTTCSVPRAQKGCFCTKLGKKASYHWRCWRKSNQQTYPFDCFSLRRRFQKVLGWQIRSNFVRDASSITGVLIFSRALSIYPTPAQAKDLTAYGELLIKVGYNGAEFLKLAEGIKTRFLFFFFFLSFVLFSFSFIINFI